MTVLLKQTLDDVENFYRHIAGFDISYEDFMDVSRESGKFENYKYLYIDRTKQ